MNQPRKALIIALSTGALIVSLFMAGGTVALAAAPSSPPPGKHYVLLSHVPSSTCLTVQNHEASPQMQPTCDWQGTGKMGIQVGYDCWQPDPVGSLECYVCVDGYCVWLRVPGY